MSKIFNRDVVVREGIDVDGNATVGGTLAVTGATSVGGALTVAGALTATGALKDSNAAAYVANLPATATVVAKTGNATIEASEFGKVITNTGASGTITLTLPAASTVAGKSIQFKVLAAQIVNVSPAATDGIFLAGSGVDNKDLVIAGTIGNTVTVYSNGDNYEAYYPNGVVTKEA